MDKTYSLEVTDTRANLYTALYNKVTEWCENELQSVLLGENGQPTMEGAQVVDRLIYQMRSVIPASLGPVASLGGDLESLFKVSIAGCASTVPNRNEIMLSVALVTTENEETN